MYNFQKSEVVFGTKEKNFFRNDFSIFIIWWSKEWKVIFSLMGENNFYFLFEKGKNTLNN